MLTSPITTTLLDTVTTVDYQKISQMGTKSVYAVPGLSLDEPQELTIAHEVNKAKTHTNSVVILDRIKDTGTVDLPVLSKARIQTKISYDHGFDPTDLRDMVAEEITLLADALVVQYLNRES